MGSTPLMEQYVFANDVNSLLKENGIKVIYKKIGDLMTSIDMAGISFNIDPFRGGRMVGCPEFTCYNYCMVRRRK